MKSNIAASKIQFSFSKEKSKNSKALHLSCNCTVKASTKLPEYYNTCFKADLYCSIGFPELPVCVTLNSTPCYGIFHSCYLQRSTMLRYAGIHSSSFCCCSLLSLLLLLPLLLCSWSYSYTSFFSYSSSSLKKGITIVTSKIQRKV